MSSRRIRIAIDPLGVSSSSRSSHAPGSPRLLAANDAPVQTELFVWVLLGTIASVFSACCAVLAGVKSGERRLARHRTTSGAWPRAAATTPIRARRDGGVLGP